MNNQWKYKQKEKNDITYYFRGISSFLNDFLKDVKEVKDETDLQTLEVKETAPHLSVVRAPSQPSVPDAPCAAGQEE